MALNNPVDGQLVKEYDTQQTVELNKNETDIMAIEDEIGTLTGKVDDLETKVGGQSIVGSILYRLGLIKDYVVEYGSNANGSYEKWASGKLVQWGIHTVSFPSPFQVWGSMFYQQNTTNITFPIPFVGSPTYIDWDIITQGGISSWKIIYTQPNILNTHFNTIAIARPAQVGGSATALVPFKAIGRW